MILFQNLKIPVTYIEPYHRYVGGDYFCNEIRELYLLIHYLADKPGVFLI